MSKFLRICSYQLNICSPLFFSEFHGDEELIKQGIIDGVPELFTTMSMSILNTKKVLEKKYLKSGAKKNSPIIEKKIAPKRTGKSVFSICSYQLNILHFAAKTQKRINSVAAKKSKQGAKESQIQTVDSSMSDAEAGAKKGETFVLLVSCLKYFL